MTGFWVFVMDPKNFLALWGFAHIVWTTWRVARWLARPKRQPRAYRPVNLND